jgi:hypothetical protein
MLKRNWPQNPDKYEEQEKILKERNRNLVFLFVYYNQKNRAHFITMLYSHQ